MNGVVPALLLVLALVAWPRYERRPVAAAPVPIAPSTTAIAEDVLSVAGALDLMALALGSGIPLVTAVDEVAAHCGPIVGGQLRRVVAALRWGVEEGRAWDGLPTIWRPAGQAVALAGISGVPPAALLRSVASDLRRVERRRIEEATGRLSVLVVIPLGLCFLPAFALLTVVPVIAALAGDLLAGMR